MPRLSRLVALVCLRAESRINHWSIPFGLLLLIGSRAYGQLPTPKLTSIFPPGGKQKTSFDVTISGSDLDGADTLLFSQVGITATQKIAPATDFEPARPVPNQFIVTIGDQVPTGICDARVVGRFGVSNPRAFEVGRYDEVTDDGSNRSFDSAKTIQPDTTVSGRIDASSRDFYRVTLQRGQRILVDCRAERIDSRMDATLVLFDAEGQELARNRDALGRDPLLAFTAPADNHYVIGLYDFIYGGGPDYFYRLTVHAGPHIDFIFPPVGQRGSRAQYAIYGRNLPGGESLSDVSLDGSTLQRLMVGIELPTDETQLESPATGSCDSLRAALVEGMDYCLTTDQGRSNAVTIGFAQAPIVAEQEPNDVAHQAQTISLPCEFVGQLYPSRDVDWVQFDANQSEVYWIEVLSHRLGVDTDPSFLLQRVTKDGKGNESVRDIVQADDAGDRNNRIGSDYDTSTDDPLYRFQVPEDGTYRLALQDQFNSVRSDPCRIYRLRLRTVMPDFQLLAAPTPSPTTNNSNQAEVFSAVVRKGGTTLINVMVQRQDDFQGEIEIAVEGLPDGAACAGALMGGTVNNAPLIISADEKAPSWAGTIRIVGRATIDGRSVVRYAGGGTLVWDTRNRQQDPPWYRVTRDLALAVMDKETAVAHIQVGEGRTYETSLGGQLEFPVKISRRGDFKSDLKLTPHVVPREFNPKEITVKGNTADGKWMLEVTNAKLAPAAYTFCLRSDVRFKYDRNPEAIKQAEAEQKRCDGLLNELTAKAKQAAKAKDAAAQAAQVAANALKQAEQARDQAAAEVQKVSQESKLAAEEELAAAEQVLTEAQTKAQGASEAQAAAERAAASADANVKTAQALKQSADKRLTDIKNANKVADRTASIFSTPIKVRVVASPVELTVPPPTDVLKQGSKVEIPVSIVRKYGFADSVEVTFEPPKDASGLSAAKLTLPKDQTEGKLEIAAANNATLGNHTITIRASMKFNKVSVESRQEIELKVDKPM